MLRYTKAPYKIIELGTFLKVIIIMIPITQKIDSGLGKDTFPDRRTRTTIACDKVISSRGLISNTGTCDLRECFHKKIG